MIEVLTAEDVRCQDAACEARGITTETLMESAGFGVARAARRLLGGTYGRRVVVVCGKGNNAGDGLVAGRHLAAWGAHVTAVLTAGDALRGAAAANLERFRRAGRVVGFDAVARELGRADLAIDAVFGVGLSRAPEGAAAEAIEQLRRAGGGLPLVAVDVPSGVDADTGQVPGGSAPAARVTVTFSGLKPGLLFSPGRALAGHVEVHDIGIPEDLRDARAHALEERDVEHWLPRRLPGSHKRGVGTVLVVAGSRAMPGAAALVAGACVHGGAGLTTLAAPETVCQVVLARAPEVTTIPIPETSEGTFDEKGLELIRPRLDEFHALALGPGLSRHPATLEAVRALLAETEIPAVVDADAITAFAGAADLLAARRGPTILTPHAGELARLLRQDAPTLERDRLRAAHEAAARLRCIVLLKGPGTVVADPSGHVFVTPTGGRALAQGGTGDVLTGLLGALMAQWVKAGLLPERRLRIAIEPREGVDAFALVAAVGAWVHGAAGDLLWERLAPHPASGSLLVEALPEVLHRFA